MAKLIDDTSLKIQNLSAVEIERIEPLDIMAVLRAIWHGKLLLACTTTIAVILAGYYAFAIATPQFAATATLEIEANNGPLVDVEQVVAGLATDQASINTEVAILRSRHLLEKVVETLSLTRDAEFNRYLTSTPPLSLASLRTRTRNFISGQTEAVPDNAAVLDKTIENLGATITAGTLRDTYIFQITATTGAPEKSALIANTLAKLYLADQVEAKYAATENAVTWLSDRVYELQLQLETKETAVNDMIAARRVSDTAVLDALSRQSVETHDRLIETRDALVKAQQNLQDFDATPTHLAATDGSSPRVRLAAEVQRYTNQIAALEVFQASIDAQLADQSEGLVRLQQLRREADATRVLYETFLARLQETSIQRGLQSADSRILAGASPGKYVAPRKMLILLIAALLGAAAGMLLVLLRHSLRKGFTRAEDLADATDLPVLAQVPRMPVRKRKNLVGYLNAKPTSAGSEAIRNLRTSLLLATPRQPPKVIMSTSSIPGEGKTTHSIALAHNLSGLGNHVLLVEADMRQSTFASYFAQAPADLAQVVNGKTQLSDAIMHDPQLGADVLAAQQISQNPADLFSSAAFTDFMMALRGDYDFVILDAPPVLPVPDARLLAQHCDAVLYTVQWDKTDARLVLAGQRALESVNAPTTGLVLSQVDAKKVQQYGGVHFAAYGQTYFQN